MIDANNDGMVGEADFDRFTPEGVANTNMVIDQVLTSPVAAVAAANALSVTKAAAGRVKSKYRKAPVGPSTAAPVTSPMPVTP